MPKKTTNQKLLVWSKENSQLLAKNFPEKYNSIQDPTAFSEELTLAFKKFDKEVIDWLDHDEQLPLRVLVLSFFLNQYLEKSLDEDAVQHIENNVQQCKNDPTYLYFMYCTFDRIHEFPEQFEKAKLKAEALNCAKEEKSIDPPYIPKYQYAFKSPKEYQAAFEAENMAEIWTQVKDFLQPEVGFYMTPATDSMPVGATKIGGIPNIFPEFLWPVDKEGDALSFIAQINFSTLDHSSLKKQLPQSGILYIFYASKQEYWGHNPEKKDQFAVFYSKNTENLTPMPTPKDTIIFPECAVDFEYTFSLPAADHPNVQKYINDEFEMPYMDISTNAHFTKLLGHSYHIQNPMELECELISRGVLSWSPNMEDLIEDTKTASNDWRLLFQCGSIPEATMMWGDVGVLYLWIREEDLQKADFSKVQLIVQCH